MTRKRLEITHDQLQIQEIMQCATMNIRNIEWIRRNYTLLSIHTNTNTHYKHHDTRINDNDLILNLSFVNNVNGKLFKDYSFLISVKKISGTHGKIEICKYIQQA